MSSHSEALLLLNRHDVPVRVRLSCGDIVVWDAWLPASGSASAPAFPGRSLSVDVATRDAATCVRWTTCRDAVAPGASLVARMVADRGATLFALDRDDDPPAAASVLRLANATSAPVELLLRIADSPYLARACVAAGATLAIDAAAGLWLDATCAGATSRRRLARTAGSWVVAPGGVGPRIDPWSPISSSTGRSAASPA